MLINCDFIGREKGIRVKELSFWRIFYVGRSGSSLCILRVEPKITKQNNLQLALKHFRSNT